MKPFPSPRRRLLAVSSVIAAFSLSSCVTENPYTGEQQLSKTTAGAGLGAVGGALLGGIIGNNVGDGNARRGALIGAGLMLAADFGSRMAGFPYDLPLGLFASLLGAPWLVWLITRSPG